MKIKIFSPSDNMNLETWWGDYWAKVFMGNALKKLGHVMVDSDLDADMSIVFCSGNFVPEVRSKIKVAWIYARHKTCLTHIEYFKKFTHVFSLSESGCSDFTKHGVSCSFLQVGTNRKPATLENYINEVTLVGNSGKPDRLTLVDEIAKHNIDLKIYGNGWHTRPQYSKHFGGRCWENSKLNILYAGSKINIISHEKEMRECGLVAIKVLDIAASKGFCLCDNNIGLPYYFRNMPVYTSNEDAIKKIKYYLVHPEERQRVIESNFEDVQRFTWEMVAEVLDNKVKEII